MGPVAMPTDFATEWAQGLFLNDRSDQDLEDRLSLLSTSRWFNKPADIPWAEWSAPARGQISSLLELNSLDDGDPLLDRILTGGLFGLDADAAIREDDRFLNTQRMRDDLSGAMNNLGQMFGFVA